MAKSKDGAHKNDLHDHMHRLQREMQDHYERIQKRVKDDPGTAGDEGEENWAEILRGWLPATYQVETKGRIMFASGQAGPQVDVVVLKPWYPRAMAKAKHFLGAGVAAAFECKTTLRSGHIQAVVDKGIEIREIEGKQHLDLFSTRHGTPFKELHSTIVYGLLAHAHEWDRPNSEPLENVDRALFEGLNKISRPREMLDLICVANLGTWHRWVTFPSGSPDRFLGAGGDLSFASKFASSVMTSYSLQDTASSSIGALITRLISALAWRDPASREMADYFRAAGLTGHSRGKTRFWPASEVLSSEVNKQLARRPTNVSEWDEWSPFMGV